MNTETAETIETTFPGYIKPDVIATALQQGMKENTSIECNVKFIQTTNAEHEFKITSDGGPMAWFNLGAISAEIRKKYGGK